MEGLTDLMTDASLYPRRHQQRRPLRSNPRKTMETVRMVIPEQSLSLTGQERRIVETTLRSVTTIGSDRRQSQHRTSSPTIAGPAGRGLPNRQKDEVAQNNHLIRQTTGQAETRVAGATQEPSSHSLTSREALTAKQKSENYRMMQEGRRQLPAWTKKNEILDNIEKNQVVIISGMTGCGKTTQVPQFLLEDALLRHDCSSYIVCTQPRRLAASSVATRVAQERGEVLGHTVGYQVRFDTKASAHTRLLYCTMGIILRRLESDPELRQNGLSHIIVDEVHERSAESDFLLMALRQLLTRRKDLKVIVMSATIKTETFAQFFGGCPVLDIPGRRYKVGCVYLENALAITKYQPQQSNATRQDNPSTRPTRNELMEDWLLSETMLHTRYPDEQPQVLKALRLLNFGVHYDLIVHIVAWILKEVQEFPEKKGAILVFLPGMSDIEAIYNRLESDIRITRLQAKLKVLPLHSMLSLEEQAEVFIQPPSDVTKVVLSTNIAETSITIDDIVYVIDSGFMKEKRYDQQKYMSALDLVRVSKANAVQRRGRAGRVKDGYCFHLFTSHTERYRMKDFQDPEIKRISLEELVLKIKQLPMFRNKEVEHVLNNLLDPPEQNAIDGAIYRLIDIGALDDNENTTPLGHYISLLPVDAKVGKLIIFGAIFRCLDPVLTLAATLSYKPPFTMPYKKEEKQKAKLKKLELAAGNSSDFMAMINAYKGFYEASYNGEESAQHFCKEFFLNFMTLQNIAQAKQEYVELLSEIGFLHSGIRVQDVQNCATARSDGVAAVVGIEGNENSNNWKLISALLVAALYPNVAWSFCGVAINIFKRTGEQRFTTLAGAACIHPSSVTFHIQAPSNCIVYHEMVKTKEVYIKEISWVPELALFLFGSGRIGVNSASETCEDPIKFKSVSAEEGNLLVDLKRELMDLLSWKIAKPKTDLLVDERATQIIGCIIKLLS